MRETPRSQATAGDSRAEPPQPRSGRALAHTTGASGSGTPHRSDGRPPQTPRGARQTGPAGLLGTTPPVPRRPASLFPALCALVFALITWQVAAGGPLRALDERASRAVAGHGPLPLAEFLADLGNMAVALPVLAAAIAYAVWRGRRRDALAVALAMALVPALVAPLKAVVDRVGPLTADTGYYPSGHAATAMVAYCGAALLVSVRLMPVAVLLTVATGIGLVLRGYHWPLDVLGSWCLCGMLLLISSRWPRVRNTRRSSSRTATG
ncbi:phosphatase PAP2 family protein [Streptomyces sp. NBC_01142]|uniref:phosphatase PAP2 family protein n=1 Tax=Streptomyces sp. NBC_01142 TaxID=2975865 RepID=UPI00225C3580|nr:phosphatase PAP2 family protein [Streptomyces sp. NBC_01142]MCX4819719.1 phosphatase PAP2 family protein [Streptomyces sp. NBC_01142]